MENEIKQKKVELIELFYDLIYVYAISRLQLLIDGGTEQAEGFVPSFTRYLVFCLIILQGWLYLTNYVNRYGRWKWYDYLFIPINMIAVLYMSNTISANWLNMTLAFNISMIVMLSCVAILYFIQIKIKEADVGAAKNTLQILIILCILYATSTVITIFGSFQIAVYIDLLAILAGAFLPFIIKGKFDKKIINFPHLLERFELLTIVSFGDAIVAITGFFDVSKFSLLPSAIFILVISLFSCYVMQIHLLINHNQEQRALRLMFSHYFVVIAINMLTISFKFLIINNSDHLFIALHTYASLIMFFISIYVNSIYHKKRCAWKKSEIILLISSFAFGFLVMMILIKPIWGLLLGCYLIVFANNFILYHKCKCTGLIDK